ncbi:MAG TPA: PAS domain S-box protein [Gammaproteobacteria bacterium]|nr:PAS domain S-box protein [Gammaproteobacteria bacterium]
MEQESPVFYQPDRIGDFGLVKIPLAYGTAAFIWIMLSQHLIDIAIPPGPVNRILQTSVGVLFVFVTAIALGWLLSRLQRRIRDGELRLQAILENSLDGIAVLRQETCLTCNPALCRMFGHESAGEIAGRSILDFVDPAEHERLRSGYREQLARYPAALQLDTVGRRADGSRFDMRMSAGMFRADGEYRLVLVVSDITAERSERARLEAENTTLARGMDRVAEGMIACDAAGRLTLLNRRARELLGLPENAVPSDCEALAPALIDAETGHLLGGVQALLQQLLRGRRIDDRPVRITPDGEETVLMQGARVDDVEEQTAGAALILEDVTRALTQRRRDRRQYELLETASRIKSVLLENASGEEMIRRLLPLLLALDPDAAWAGITLFSGPGETASLHQLAVDEAGGPQTLRFSARGVRLTGAFDSIRIYGPDDLGPLERPAPVRDSIESARVDSYLHLPLTRGGTAVGAVNLGRRATTDPEAGLLAVLGELQHHLAGRVAAAGRPPAWRETE